MNLDRFFAELAASLGALEHAAVAFLPRLVAAALALIVAMPLAWTLRALLRRALRGLARRLPAHDEGRGATNALAGGVFWLVIWAGVLSAGELLGLRVLSTWLGAVATYMPNLVLAVLIGVAGIGGGRLANAAIQRASGRWAPHQARQIGRLTQVTLGLVALLVAASQLGLDVSLLSAVFLILLASTLGGAALAFGLGARTIMANILAMHYVDKAYGIGQLVRVGEHEGRILRTSPTSVFLEHPEGEIAIPGHEFAQLRCIRRVSSHGA